MFKNKAMYVRVIDTNVMQPVGELAHDPADRSVETIIDNIVSTQGREVVRGVVIIMTVYFGLSTLRGVILKSVPLRK